MLPVGFDGELIIIPFTELEIFDFNVSILLEIKNLTVQYDADPVV